MSHCQGCLEKLISYSHFCQVSSSQGAELVTAVMLACCSQIALKKRLPVTSHRDCEEKKTVFCLLKCQSSRNLAWWLKSVAPLWTSCLPITQPHPRAYYSHSSFTVSSTFVCVYSVSDWVSHIAMTANSCVIKMLPGGEWGGYLTQPVDQPPELPSLCMCRNLLSGQSPCHIPLDSHHAGLMSEELLTGWSAHKPWKDFQRHFGASCQGSFLFPPLV